MASEIKYSKILVASWLHSGSNFVIESIRENFPEYENFNNSIDKTHIKCSYEQYKDSAIIFVISDPRDANIHIGFNEDGWAVSYINQNFHKYSEEAKRNIRGLKFLNENTDVIIDLHNYYTTTFNNCIVIKYEDMQFYPKVTLNKIGEYLNMTPLYVDNPRKYKHSINKSMGIFNKYLTTNIIKSNFIKYNWFYDKYNYYIDGYNKITHSSFRND